MRSTWLVGILGVVLVTAAWWLFLISPRSTEIADLENQLQAAVDSESRLMAQIAQLREIRDAEVQYIAGIGQMETLIPERPGLEDFIEQIYDLANETGVDLQNLNPSLPSAAAGVSELREIAIGAQVEAEFFEVLGFLFGLSDMDRLVRIDGITVASSQDEAGATILSVSLELRLFTLADLVPLPEETPDTEEGGTTTTSVGTSEAGG